MKKTLIVIDMQNDFITGSLGTPEAIAIVPKVKEKIAAYKSADHEIIYTRDTHTEDYLNTPEGKKLPVEHCIKDSTGWQIADDLYIEGSLCIDKPNFGWPYWNTLNLEDVEEIELVGLCTDICVVSNALILKATFPNAEISVDASCCAGVTPQTHKAALETMKMCQIIITNE